MEMTKKITKNNRFSLEWKKIENYIFPLFAMCFILFENAFLFNPFILAILFVSYKKSGVTYLLTFFTLIFTSTLINISYAIEIVLIGIVQFFLSFSLVRIKTNHKYEEYYPAIVLCLLISMMMIARSFEIDNIFSCALNTTITLLLINYGNKIVDYFENEESNLSKVTELVFFLIIIISSMVFPIFGLILLRLLLMSQINKKDSVFSLLLTLSSFLLLFLVYQYSLGICLMIITPCLAVFFNNKKQKIIGYFSLLIFISYAVDPLFYSNGVFYQGLIAGLIITIVPIDKFLLIRKKEIKDDKKIALEAISKIQDYLSAINFEFESNPLTPIDKAYIRVYHRVCARCEHLEYCKLTKNLREFIVEKITSEGRKQINKDCIKPYKLTLELQQGHQIYISSESYYQEALKRKEMVLDVIKSIEPTLLSVRKELIENYSIIEKIKRELTKEKIEVKDIKILKDKVEIIFKNVIDDFQKGNVKTILCLCLKESFEIDNDYISYLNHNYVIEYKSKETRSISITPYSKAASFKNGDTIIIKENNKRKMILLCDGMGHDEKAHYASLGTANTFMTLYRQNNNIHRHLEQINNMFLIGSTYENYSTFDFMEIDLQTLELTSIKAGSMESYIIREGKIIVIPSGGLPLGSLDEVDYKKACYQLQVGDVLLIVSDGIGEVINKLDPNVLININDEKEFYRDLFNLAILNMKHLDDASMIVCKIL